MDDAIKVVIRLRPLIAREHGVKKTENFDWAVNENNIQLFLDGTPTGTKFTFDCVFSKEVDTFSLYDEIARPLVESAMSGFHSTIFAYGQTSSGKTHTMMGSETEPGIIPTAIRHAFASIEETPEREFLIRVSYIEIYNEKLFDLLSIETKELTIKEDLDHQVYVAGAREEVVDSVEAVEKMMRLGNKKRRVAETKSNERSSRSHVIFRVIIESGVRGDSQDAVQVAHFNLVDLAGSERASENSGDRLKEGCKINLSLFNLGEVISALSNGSSLVNFRNSKLTRILQNSLGGNSKTAIICTVTPASNLQTTSTLRFASQAKCVHNKAIVNEVISEAAMLKRAHKEIKKLQSEITQLTSNETLQKLQHYELEKNSMQEQIENLKRMICVSTQALPPKTLAAQMKIRRRMTWCPTATLPVTPNVRAFKPVFATMVEEQAECESSLTTTPELSVTAPVVLSRNVTTRRGRSYDKPKSLSPVFMPMEAILDGSFLEEMQAREEVIPAFAEAATQTDEYPALVADSIVTEEPAQENDTLNDTEEESTCDTTATNGLEATLETRETEIASLRLRLDEASDLREFCMLEKKIKKQDPSDTPTKAEQMKSLRRSVNDYHSMVITNNAEIAGFKGDKKQMELEMDIVSDELKDVTVVNSQLQNKLELTRSQLKQKECEILDLQQCLDERDVLIEKSKNVAGGHAFGAEKPSQIHQLERKYEVIDAERAHEIEELKAELESRINDDRGEVTKLNEHLIAEREKVEGLVMELRVASGRLVNLQEDRDAKLEELGRQHEEGIEELRESLRDKDTKLVELSRAIERSECSVDEREPQRIIAEQLDEKVALIETMKTDLERANFKLAELEENSDGRAALVNELRVKNVEIEDLQDLCERLEISHASELDKLTGDVSRKDEVIECRIAQIEKLKIELEEVNLKFDEKEIGSGENSCEVERLAEKVRTATEEIDRKVAEINSLIEELNTVKNMRDESTTSHKQEMERVTESLKQKNDENERSRSQIIALKEEVRISKDVLLDTDVIDDELCGVEVTHLKTELERVTAEFMKLTENNRGFQEKIDRDGVIHSENLKELIEIQEESEKMRLKQDGTLISLEELKVYVTDLERENVENAQSMEDLRVKMKEFKMDKANGEQEGIDNSDRRELDDLREKLSKAEDELNTVNDRSDKLDLSHSREKEELVMTLKQKNEEIDMKMCRIISLKEELETCRESTLDIKGDESTSIEIMRLKEELERVTTEVVDFMEINRERKEKIEEYEGIYRENLNEMVVMKEEREVIRARENEMSNKIEKLQGYVTDFEKEKEGNERMIGDLINNFETDREKVQTGDVEMLYGELKVCMKEANEIRKKLSDAEEENLVLSQYKTTTENQIEEIKEDYLQMKAELEEKTSRLRDLDISVDCGVDPDELQRQLAETKAKLDSVQKYVEKLNAENNERSAALKSEHDFKETGLISRIEELRSEIEALQADNAELSDEREKADEELCQREYALKLTELRLDERTKEVEGAKSDLTSLKSDYKTAQDELESLNAYIDRGKSYVEELQEAFDANLDTVREQESEINSLRNEIEAAKVAYEGTIEEFGAESTDRTNADEDLRRTLEQTESERRAMEVKLSELEACKEQTVEELGAKMNVLENEKIQLEESLAEYKHRAKSLLTEIQATSGKDLSLREQLEMLNSTNAELVGTVADLRQELEEAQSRKGPNENLRSNAEVEALIEQVEALTEESRNLREEKEKELQLLNDEQATSMAQHRREVAESKRLLFNASHNARKAEEEYHSKVKSLQVSMSHLETTNSHLKIEIRKITQDQEESIMWVPSVADVKSEIFAETRAETTTRSTQTPIRDVATHLGGAAASWTVTACIT